MTISTKGVWYDEHDVNCDADNPDDSNVAAVAAAATAVASAVAAAAAAAADDDDVRDYRYPHLVI